MLQKLYYTKKMGNILYARIPLLEVSVVILVATNTVGLFAILLKIPVYMK